MNNTQDATQDPEAAADIAARRGPPAAVRGMPMVRVLIDAGADLDAVDDTGRTALIVAVERGQIDVVEGLLAAGASVNARGAGQRTALIAAVSDHKKIEPQHYARTQQ